MRYLPSDKYNVAWFKLAECVARGERERALGVYRLLSHSFDDPAFASQLEGDILVAFSDPVSAVVKYKEAVALYKSSNRTLEAAAVAEHILVLEAEKQESIELLIELYKEVGNEYKTATYLHMLFALTLGMHNLDRAAQILDEYQALVGVAKALPDRQQLLFSCIKNQPMPREPEVRQLELILNGLLEGGKASELNAFLSYIEGLNPYYRAVAHEYLEKHA
ncbi:MAG: hypothetical protein ACHQVS_03525 [Candidatus Babeliales bacterium]